MLIIRRDLVDDMIAHARACHPIEACGYVAGPEGSGAPERLVRMTNAANSREYFEFDSAELFTLYKDMQNRDEDPVVIYHSHTASIAYPSRTDRRYASEPDAHYVIVSTQDPIDAEVRSYRISDGVATEEDITILDPDPAVEVRSRTSG